LNLRGVFLRQQQNADRRPFGDRTAIEEKNSMYFALVDRIVSLTPDEIVTTKSLALGEEYLRDHFPKFPVMPGVLMLEAMAESCSWHIRVNEDFAHSMILLKSVKNVKFGHFLQPGQTLVVTAVLVSQDDHQAVYKVNGEINGKSRVRAQLTMSKYNLAEKKPNFASMDDKLKAQLRENLAIIWNRDEENEQ